MDAHIQGTEARRISEGENTAPQHQPATVSYTGGLPDISREMIGGPARGFVPTLVAIEIVIEGISKLLAGPQVRDRISFSRTTPPENDPRPLFRQQCRAAVEILSDAATNTSEPTEEGFTTRIMALGILHRMELFNEMAFPRESDLYSAAHYCGDANMRLLMLDLKHDLLIAQIKIQGMHHGISIGG